MNTRLFMDVFAKFHRQRLTTGMSFTWIERKLLWTVSIDQDSSCSSSAVLISPENAAALGYSLSCGHQLIRVLFCITFTSKMEPAAFPNTIELFDKRCFLVFGAICVRLSRIMQPISIFMTRNQK